jgi:RES domain-containing protein
MGLRTYRICKTRHQPFDGSGAAIYGGRWNSPGHPVIYAVSSFSGALLEILAHAGRDRLPGPHHLITIDIPLTVPILRIVEENVPGWNMPEAEVSRAFGDAWLAARKTAVMLVPSVIGAPHESNVVINPHHPDIAQLRISEPKPVRWDPRLFPSATLSRP